MQTMYATFVTGQRKVIEKQFREIRNVNTGVIIQIEDLTGTEEDRM